jgi:GAF domain-containing protein
MALPIVGRAGESLGALTIQSERPRAFSEEDVTVLQVIADQLGSAIESVNLLQRTQAALRELEATQRRYQQQAWSDYLTASRISGYEVKRENLPPLGDEVRREIEAALERQAPTTMANDAAEMPEDGAALVVPITHRSGAVMGALGIHDDPGREWTDDEIALIQAVVERMGLAAENLRLLDETQRRVAMEQLTQDITGRMRQSLDVEQVLRAAVEGFVDAFDVDEVHLRLVDPRRSASSEERSNGDQE